MENLETMNSNVNGTVQLLLQRIVDRLENSPVEFVEAFIDLLTAPERKRDHELLKDLLVQLWFFFEYPELFASLSPTRINTDSLLNGTLFTPYDRLIQMLRASIEAEIFRYLAAASLSQFAQPDNKALHRFWGGLTLHIKLSLPFETHLGPRLFSKGFVKTSDGKTFFCEPPLSESQIFELLTRLGPSFVFEYASSHFQQDELRCRTLSLARDSLQLRIQKRTLNRYVNKFSKRLAEQFREGYIRLAANPQSRVLTLLSSSTLESVVAQLIAEASSLLFIQPICVTSPTPVSILETTLRKTDSPLCNLDEFSPSAEARISDEMSRHASEPSIVALPNAYTLLTTSQLFSTERLWEDICRVQQKKISDGIYSVYVPQNLEYTDLKSETQHQTTMDELIIASNKCLILTAPPDGGKTRFQQELILRTSTSPNYHIGINLNNFVSSRFHSFHQFAAFEILKMLKQPYGTIIRLAEELLTLDLEHKICWHFDGWDDTPESERPAISMTIASLSQFTFTASSPSSLIKYLRDKGVDVQGVITIHPFAIEQIHEFINLNFAGDAVRIQRCAFQLPGLARLPGGLEHICKFPGMETIVEILLGYINRNLERIGEPAINPDELIFDSLKEFDWQSESFIAAYRVVKAAVSLALIRKNFSVIRPNEILPYMGGTNRERNHLLATHGITQGVRAKLWQSNNENQSLQFIVPEVGLLLAAVASCASVNGPRWLDYTLGKFQHDPCDPFYQIMMTLAMWHQEKYLCAPLPGTKREPRFRK